MQNAECRMQNGNPRAAVRTGLRLCALHSALCTCLLSGCTWLDKIRTRPDGAATATGGVTPARAEQLVERLNQNAQAVSVVRYDDVSITLDGPDVPVGGGSLANSSLIAAKPRLFRLNAGKNIRRDLLQVGSNEQEFWLYGDVPGQDKMFLVCAHKDFPKAANKLPVPIDPDWALLALGLIGTDPDVSLYKADTNTRRREYTLTRDVTAPGGRKLERTTVFAADVPTGDQPLVKRHVISEPGGKKVVATADVLSVYRLPGNEQAEVPTKMVLEWPEQKFKMTLRMQTPVVNEPLDPARVQEWFGRPATDTRPQNLADVTFQPTARGAAPAERRGVFGQLVRSPKR